jgi:hypothetical protein
VSAAYHYRERDGVAILGHTRLPRSDGRVTHLVHCLVWCSCGWRQRTTGEPRAARWLAWHRHVAHREGPAVQVRRDRRHHAEP